MTKAELLNYATDNGIAGVSASQKKSEIIEVITNAEETGNEED